MACNDWLRLGAGRTLPELLERYTDTNQTVPITGSLQTLKAWSMTFKWAERAVEYDAGWEAKKNTERERVLAFGLALDYERIRKLYRLAAMLEAQIYERGLEGVLHNLWVPDVKMIGTYPNQERVDIERFNAPLLEQYRKVLDDIAQETGGRGKNVKYEEVTAETKMIDAIRARANGITGSEWATYSEVLRIVDGDTSKAADLFRMAGVPIADVIVDVER